MGAKRAGESSTPEHLNPLEPVGRLVEDLLGPGQDRGWWWRTRPLPERLLPRRPTRTHSPGHAASTPPPSGSAALWAQPR